MASTLAILNRASLLGQPPTRAEPPLRWERRLPEEALLPRDTSGWSRQQRALGAVLKRALLDPTGVHRDAPLSPEGPRSGPLAGLRLFIEGATEVALGKVGERIIASADVLGPRDLPASSPLPAAEAATALRIAPSEDPRFGPRIHWDFSHSSSPSSPFGPLDWLRSLLKRTQSGPGPIDRVLSVTADETGFREEIAALEQLLPRISLLHLPWRTGDAGASLGLLGVHAGLEESGVTLIMGSDSCRATALILSVP